MSARGRVQIQGRLNSGAEKWSTGFHLGALTLATDANCQAAVDFITTEWISTVWSSSLDAYISDHTTFERVILSDVNAAGVIVRQFGGSEGSIAGAYGGNPLPPQISPVVSLLTGLPGARNRGRMYFPSLGANANDSTGSILEAAQHLLCEKVADFFTAVNGAGVDVTSCIYSGAQSSVVPITSVRVGTVWDTQRRRRDNLTETYYSQDV